MYVQMNRSVYDGRVEQSCRPNARVCEISYKRLGRQHVWILWTSLAGHEKTQLSHTFGSLARLRFPFVVVFTLTIALLLVKFLLSALTLLFEALHNVDGSSNMCVIFASIRSIAISSDQARRIILTAEGIWGPWERLGMRQSWSRGKHSEWYSPARLRRCLWRSNMSWRR